MAARVTFDGLEPYKLTGLTVTDRELGHGSYATVLQLDYMGLKCAGKKIHELLLQTLQGDTSYAVRRFEEECRLLSQVRHPNIVQFLGVHFQEGVPAPILVMEFLHTNLTSCIEQYGILPKEISYSILHDVALGLCYLHRQTPPIIHRDLSSNNVLLTANMTAKISDLGVARILNLTPLQRSQRTQTPGTPAYMPPEVMIANPKYDISLDEFSYGILMIHMFSGRWPEPQVGQTRFEGDQLIPVTEAERREVFLRAIGNDHPLMDLILRCINNDPRRRAHASETVERLSELVSQFPASYTSQLEMLLCINTLNDEKRALEEEREELSTAIQQKDNEISTLREKIEDMETSHESGEKQLQLQKEQSHADKTLQASRYSLLEQNLADSVYVRDSAIRRNEAEIEAKNRVLKTKDGIITQLDEELTKTRKCLATKPQTPKACIRWKECKDLPERISGGQAIVINGRIYCGGQDSEHSEHCYMYESSQDTWTTLPPLTVRYYGLGQVNGKLVSIGGQILKDGRLQASNHLYTYDEKPRKWRNMLPNMPTARFDPGVLSLESALLVAGGQFNYMGYTNAVEILKLGEKADALQWHRTNPLPTACRRISIVANDNTCYALGGFEGPSHLNQALYASVDDLLHNAVPANQTTRSGSSDTQSPWKNLPPTMSYNPAAALLGGNLIALGGWEDSGGKERRKQVYVYSSSANSWIYISDLPVPLARSIAAVLSCAKIVIIGGFGVNGNVKNVYSGVLTVDL